MSSALRWIVAAAVIGLAGCATSEPSRFYSLAPLDDAPLADVSMPGLVLGISAPELPDYLDRPQMVTRSSPTQLELAEFDKWIEPLGAMVTRVLIQNLTFLTGSDQILLLPQRRQVDYDGYLEIEILRFDEGPEGMQLDARWSIVDADEQTLLATGRSLVSEPIDPGNTNRFDAIARAMSLGLFRMSVEIASAIRTSSL